MTIRPRLWIFAGPNRAGKSTIVARLHVADRLPVINPDTIARRLEPNHHIAPALMLKADRIAASEPWALIQRRRGFGMETTLAGHSEPRMMDDARAAGYKITAVFLGVGDALSSLARVRVRVAQIGHHVPARIIVRRCAKSLANLPTAIGLTDRCFVLDNTRNRHRLLLTIDEGRVRHLRRGRANWATKADFRAALAYWFRGSGPSPTRNE